MAPTVAYLVVLATLGMVGNSLVFLVYFKRFKPSATKIYIQTMSVLDLATNVYCLCVEIPMYVYKYRSSSVACKLTTSLTAFLVFFSGLVLVAVALDRQQTISKRQIKSPESVKKAWRAVLACGIVSFVINTPRLHLAESHTVSFTGSNMTGQECSALKPEQSVFALVYGILLIVAFVVSLIILVICYGAIVWSLWQHRKRRAM